MITYAELTDEQKKFIEAAKVGHNVLVEACIGSGKTTAIQILCEHLPPWRNVLYLTYNMLLKLDAKDKIKSINGQVTNYHGFAYGELAKQGVRVGLSELIQTYNRSNVPAPRIDTLILDEYQDIEQEIADMLMHLKEQNPQMQIVAVGDMAQKIYDKTTLNVKSFIYDFIGPGAVPMEFTKCFRLCDDLASELGEIWGKEIHGVNPDCEVLRISFEEAFDLLAESEPSEILCLGSNNGARSEMLNYLEEAYPHKFNKNTVWSNITEREGGASHPRPDCAIFTTYDGCKGMERDVCVVFDWTVDYWYLRLDKANTRYEILRNIFCVAASRGKKKVVFVETSSEPLTKEVLMEEDNGVTQFEDVSMSTMFDFKYIEDVEAAFAALDVKEVQPEESPINVPTTDGFIDLSPCVGMYQEMAYFKGADIDKYIEAWFKTNRGSDGRRMQGWEQWTLDQKILYFVMLETNQNRYFHQVMPPFVTAAQWQEIEARLSAVLPADARAQVGCEMPFYQGRRIAFKANGFADIVFKNIVYELKFIEALSHVHFLQCAMYMASQHLSRGRLWNVRTNQMYEIRIPDRQLFLDRVAIAVTKGTLQKYKGLPAKSLLSGFVKANQDACLDAFTKYQSGKLPANKVKAYLDYKGIALPCTGQTFLTYMTELKRALKF